MLKNIKTVSGFECAINTDFLDDVEMLDMMLATQEGDTLQFGKMARKILGEEQYQKAKDFIRNEKGVAPLSKMMALLEEVFNAVGEDGKNS